MQRLIAKSAHSNVALRSLLHVSRCCVALGVEWVLHALGRHAGGGSATLARVNCNALLVVLARVLEAREVGAALVIRQQRRARILRIRQAQRVRIRRSQKRNRKAVLAVPRQRFVLTEELTEISVGQRFN